MESTKNELKRSKIESLLEVSHARDSLDFVNLNSYLEKREANMVQEQKGFEPQFSPMNKSIYSDIKSQASEISYFKKKVMSEIVPLKDKIVLSEIQKYFKFGIFPYIFFVHIGIVLLTTIIVIFKIN